MWNNIAQQDQDDELNVCQGLQPLTSDNTTPSCFYVQMLDITGQIYHFISCLEIVAKEDTELNKKCMQAIKKLKILTMLGPCRSILGMNNS